MAQKNKTSMVHVRVEEGLKDEASRVLARFGLTTSEAIRIFLTRVVAEKGLPVGMTQDKASHDEWVRASVREAMENSGPRIPHDEAMASIRENLAAKIGSGEPRSSYRAD
jgi:DNA-damage-inducible protein J|nr:type II toxin-antitoxin system RelB/DinJ family antitoxin [Neorhizobium tomejilense]